MSGTFDVEWQPDGVLLLRRTGLLSLDEGIAYAAAAKKAIRAAPADWAILVDLRDAGAGDEVRAQIGSIVQYSVKHNVRQIAVVTMTAAEGIQQRRISTAPNLVDSSVIAFYTDVDEARAALRRPTP
jgi:hypothetical protein